MKFSEQFSVTRTKGETWFDPLLTIDTQLFIDPFLLYYKEDGRFKGSHEEVIAFFNSIFAMIARSGGDTRSVHWKRAEDRLRFPEVPELCLGYGVAGTRGSGSGAGFARVIAGALWEAVIAGVEELHHFEEIGILREGIGADRISDITAGLLRRRLAAYTQEVCKRHGVPMGETNFRMGQYDLKRGGWAPLQTHLPRNPHNNRAVLLVPRPYLRDLPTMNADDFWEFCYYNENETLRREFSDDVTSRVDKRTIVNFARRHPELRARYEANLRKRPPEPYDLSTDQKGFVRWYDAAAQHCAANPLEFTIKSEDEFLGAIDHMVEAFRHYVQENRGWKLLINDNGTPRGEKASQNLFLGTILQYCRANNIVVSPETDIGRGPVDFKLSRGYALRALLEVKLAKNTKFWRGLEKQLPTYLGAERIKTGYFMVMVQSEADLKRLSGIQDRIHDAERAHGVDLKYVMVDARKPPPASKL